VEVYGPSDAAEAQPLNDFLADAGAANEDVDVEAEEVAPAFAGVKRGKAPRSRYSTCRSKHRGPSPFDRWRPLLKGLEAALTSTP
jgi:hypothetical protein